MSTGAWIRRQRDRPIAEHERRTALATAAVLLTATAVLLALTAPGAHQQHTVRTSQVRNAPALQTPAGETTTAPLTPVVEEAANRFLGGYLSYLYGHAPATQVKGATARFTRSLEAHPPRVPPGIRARAPRVVALHITRAPRGLVGVTALVNDGGLVNYPIGLLLEPQGGQLLVSGLAGA